jgi:hypothetical protein
MGITDRFGHDCLSLSTTRAWVHGRQGCFKKRAHWTTDAVLPETNQDFFVILVTGVHRSGRQFGETSEVERSDTVGALFAEQLKGCVKE